jgi:hypothetical protein
MALETFARASLAQFTTIYAELYDGKGIAPSELEALMWGRICAKDANISKLGFKINYENIKRAKVTLPYMPDDINYSGCPCIKKNGGLYTPCCAKVAEDAEYCKSCSVDKEGNEKPLEFGVIDDRDENIENRVFSPLTYGEWMRAKKTTLPEVYQKLAQSGIQLEIPARELICRAVAKNRKGRPAKDTDSAEDEDAPVKKPRAKASPKSPKASPKSSPKSSPDASDESASEDESPPLPQIKAKKPEDEPKKPKAKAEAKSDEDEPKKPKAKAESDEPKEPKAKKAPKAESKSDEDEPKKKAKAKKAESGDDEPKAKKAPKAEPKAKKPKTPEPVPEPEEPAEEEAEEGEVEEQEEEECEVDGKDYTLRNNKYICDKEDGTILGTIVHGKVTWSGERR